MPLHSKLVLPKRRVLMAGGDVFAMAACQDFPVLPDLPSPHKGIGYFALEGFPFIRVVCGFGVVKGAGGMEFPTDARIQDGKIGILANLNAAFAVVQAEYPGRVGCGDLC